MTNANGLVGYRGKGHSVAPTSRFGQYLKPRNEAAQVRASMARGEQGALLDVPGSTAGANQAVLSELGQAGQQVAQFALFTPQGVSQQHGSDSYDPIPPPLLQAVPVTQAYGQSIAGFGYEHHDWPLPSSYGKTDYGTNDVVGSFLRSKQPLSVGPSIDRSLDVNATPPYNAPNGSHVYSDHSRSMSGGYIDATTSVSSATTIELVAAGSTMPQISRSPSTAETKVTALQLGDIVPFAHEFQFELPIATPLYLPASSSSMHNTFIDLPHDEDNLNNIREPVPRIGTTADAHHQRRPVEWSTCRPIASQYMGLTNASNSRRADAFPTASSTSSSNVAVHTGIPSGVLHLNVLLQLATPVLPVQAGLYDEQNNEMIPSARPSRSIDSAPVNSSTEEISSDAAVLGSPDYTDEDGAEVLDIQWLVHALAVDPDAAVAALHVQTSPIHEGVAVCPLCGHHRSGARRVGKDENRGFFHMMLHYQQCKHVHALVQAGLAVAEPARFIIQWMQAHEIDRN